MPVRVLKAILLVVAIVLMFSSVAEARCRTDECWKRVHHKRVINFYEKKIDKITPYQCGPVQSVKPCWVIYQESSMCGYWRALNGCNSRWDGRIPCLRRACGLYQFLGWNVPWPVIVKSKLETLRRKLAHHRQAARLGLSHWGG